MTSPAINRRLVWVWLCLCPMTADTVSLKHSSPDLSESRCRSTNTIEIIDSIHWNTKSNIKERVQPTFPSAPAEAKMNVCQYLVTQPKWGRRYGVKWAKYQKGSLINEKKQNPNSGAKAGNQAACLYCEMVVHCARRHNKLECCLDKLPPHPASHYFAPLL